MAETENSDSKKRSVVELYKEFCEKTTMHGIGRVFANRSPCRRFIWTVLVVFVTGFAVFQFVNIIGDFLLYPVTTVVTVRHESKVRFPAVTICNLNIRRRSFSPNIWKPANYTEFESANMQAAINAALKTSSRAEGNASAHQISDMIVRCIFNKNFCNKTDFTESYSSTQGKCFTLTITSPLWMYTFKSGPDHGLILEVDIQHREYLYLTPSAGVYVLIHEPDETPFSEDGGILAQPGHSTHIGFRKTEAHLLPAPYGNCLSAEDTSSSRFNIFSDENYTYTQVACRKSCYQLSLYKKCGCCDNDLPCNSQLFRVVRGKKADLVLRFCDTPADGECIIKVEEQYMKDELDCFKLCLPECDRSIYKTVVSTARWPADAYMDVLLYRIGRTVLRNMTFESKSSRKLFIENNFLRLEIYFDSLVTLEFVTQPKYDWSMLLGGIGGHLGLWLGFSLLTAIELIELIIDTLLFSISKE